MSWSVYIVECSDGTFYTGISTDVEARIEAHNNGRGAKYTPVELRYVKTDLTKSEALKLEADMKKWPRYRKLNLIEMAERVDPLPTTILAVPNKQGDNNG